MCVYLYRLLCLLFVWMIFPLGCTANNDLVDYLRSKAIPFNHTYDLGQLFDDASDRRLVLLGEASHGTHEYYAWRDSISRRLMADHGFRFVAVEGDWASLYELNRYVKNMPGAAGSAREVLSGLDRWPLWMWGNEEVLALAEWMREFNKGLPQGQKAGFYGMDVYDEWRSKDILHDMLASMSDELYQAAGPYLRCMSPYHGDSWLYARQVAETGRDCSRALADLYALIEANADQLSQTDEEAYFYLRQNAMVFKNAEKFYRKSATRRDASSWNSRARHMHQTVSLLLDKYGANAKGIVWAHNTHIGDARFTDMVRWGQENIGHLSRELHGPEDVMLVGFTTYRGAVQAGAEWGSRRQRMRIPGAIEGSIEYLLNRTGKEQFIMIFDDDDRTHEEFSSTLGNRAVGVVYNPSNDRRQFVPTVVPLRYDALIFFRETGALTPIH